MKKFMIKLFVVFAPFFMLGAVNVGATETDDVDATVTAQNVSVLISDGSISYGTVSLSGSKFTHSGGGGLNDTQTATNNGNVNEDFDIKGFDTLAWTLGTSAGSETYAYKYCKATCTTPPTNYVEITTGYLELATGIVPTTGNQTFDLGIYVPTATATYTSQDVKVTILATAS